MPLSNSKLPTANPDTFEIKGHSTHAVHAMLRHIYNKPLEGPTPARGFHEQLDHHFAMFLIGNEYEIYSLCQFSAQSVVRISWIPSCGFGPGHSVLPTQLQLHLIFSRAYRSNPGFANQLVRSRAKQLHSQSPVSRNPFQRLATDLPDPNSANVRMCINRNPECYVQPSTGYNMRMFASNITAEYLHP